MASKEKNVQKWGEDFVITNSSDSNGACGSKSMHDRSFVRVPIGGDSEGQRIGCRP